MKRLLTAVVALPLSLAAVFYLPPLWFFVFLLLVIEIELYEFVRLARCWAESAPHEALLVLVPAGSLLLTPSLLGAGEISPEYLLGVAVVLSVGIGALVLCSRTRPEESMSALGALGFGVVYFSLPLAALFYLRERDPWLVVLAMAIVWLGDTAAWAVGTLWGRRKLAPQTSPNKTWEGAIGNLVVGVLAACGWSLLRLGEVWPPLVLLAAVTSIGAQIGDLLESMVKRGAGCKDSGNLLPGHGGMLDRMDAMNFGAPVLAVGLWLIGIDRVTP